MEAAHVVQRDRQAPLLVVGGGDHDLPGPTRERERAMRPLPDHAGDQHGVLGAVDRAFREHVAELPRPVAAVRGAVGQPGQPSFGRRLPAVPGIDRRAAGRIQHQGVRALGDHQATDVGVAPDRRRHRPGPVRGGGAAGQRRELRRAVGPAPHAVDADLRAFHRAGGGQGGHDQAHAVRVLDRRQHQVGHLHAHPAPRRAVGGAQAHEVAAGLAGAADAGQVRRQVQAELRIDAAAADRQVDQRRDGWRAERLHARSHAGGADG